MLDGQDIAHTPPNQRPINTVFQNHALFSHMSVADNAGFTDGYPKVGFAKWRDNVAILADAQELYVKIWTDLTK